VSLAFMSLLCQSIRQSEKTGLQDRRSQIKIWGFK